MKKFILAFVLFLASANCAWADTYYCMVFAFDSKPVPIPVLCHIWGTFVHVDAKGKVVEQTIISWGPDDVSYIDKARPGVNCGYDCLNYATKENRSIRAWGPFEINKHFYAKAKDQSNAGGKYKFIDCTNRKSHQNCIHRLSDIAGPHKTGIYWGWWAAESVYKHYDRKGVIRRTPQSDEIYTALGMYNYDIKRMVK